MASNLKQDYVSKGEGGDDAPHWIQALLAKELLLKRACKIAESKSGSLSLSLKPCD